MTQVKTQNHPHPVKNKKGRDLTILRSRLSITLFLLTLTFDQAAPKKLEND